MFRSCFILFALPLVFASAGCCKKKLYCSPGGLKIVIAGYPRLDVRNIIVKKYKIGEHSKALDSATFVYSGSVPIVLNKKDTLDFADYKTTSATMTGVYIGYDWYIELPGTPGREKLRISSIVDAEHRFEMIRCGDHDAKCVNPIAHFVVNEVWKQGDTLWIEKKK